MDLTLSDYIVFSLYFVAVVVFAIIMGWRKKTESAEGFFMASRKLPWYVVGASIIAAGVSAEHFIGTIGWAYLYGMAVANWQWGAVFVYSILIWIFLPFYMRGNVSTMPEFLERRYNKTCRYIYASITITGMVVAVLGGVTFAGAKALNILFPELSIPAAILLMGIAAGIYTVYGGLVSGAWADVLQYIVLMVGGLTVTFFGLSYVGGIGVLLDALPEKTIMLYPPDHEAIPWTGLITAFLTVGVWYNCANQFIVQRILGARSEWDARMGVIMAGFTFSILPFIIVIPGLIAFYMYPDLLSDGDQAWPLLVKQFLPPGVTGFVLAGLAAAIMSTLSAIIHSSATIFTLDLYKPVFRPSADDNEIRLVGRIAGTVCVLTGLAVALFLAALPGLTVFGIIQTVFFYVAAPIAAIFILGILWSGATPRAATLSIIIGFLLVPVVRYGLFKLPALAPYDSFTHHTFVVFIASLIMLTVISLFTTPKPKEELKGVIWNSSALSLPEKEKHLNRGFRNFVFWWAIMVLVILFLYAWTNTRASGTNWLEAEQIKYTSSVEDGARIQARQELERFSLWTGSKQVLFTPKNDGDSITFQLPVDSDGEYTIAAVITKGPDYGKFMASVDGSPAVISFEQTEALQDTHRFIIETVEVEEFNAKHANHVVRRITLGTHILKEGTVTVSLEAVDVTSETAFIGVDQWILTRND